MWVFDNTTREMVHRNVTYVPGLYKIFDEIIVNAADNKQRDINMNRLEVTINPDENSIRVWNNGCGIPVVLHKEHGIYVPELIFGNLLTGSNFDDNEEKTTGGRNGYGAKLANIFSTEFTVETADSERGLKFKQVFRNNMSSKSTPEISKYNGTDFTCITFKPDLARFKMDFMDDDIVALLSKRAYDIQATMISKGPKLQVILNSVRVEPKSFESYIAIHSGLEEPIAFEKVNERWEIGVGVSDGSFTQVSYVNSISTTKGGCHVSYITDQITTRLMATIKKKNKGQEVKANQIKNHLAVYVNSLIQNPAFDSQTKENLTTKEKAFGSTCTVPDSVIKKLEKSSLIDNILAWSKQKQNLELKKKSGSKRSKLFGITKLDDANFAGTAKSRDCTLILTEGDSAKALAVSGLGVVGRDYYGVFPLKGKLLNVREAAHASVLKNDEISNIVKILGLTFGKVYNDVSDLRYGHLMIMSDQDHDGSHIKGLIINFIHHFWPSLLKVDGFLEQFITPIVKCTKGNKTITFFTVPQYDNWKEDNNDGRGWKIKYYKGLGTSTASEAKEYFSNLQTHEVTFSYDDRAEDCIELAFAKKRVDDRKLWLLSMEPGTYVDYGNGSITYDEFINRELILFSHADNERSIPHFMDGLKPSQRKVLFSCFKRNLKNDIKVAQLAGYISEHSAYHHGEASLTQTVISMAQNFVGTNNINLLSPCGQFGTRLMGGKDAASPRYVFTKLETITRAIFHPNDDPLLKYLDDDGQSIEPLFYVPVIPMVLVNGTEGIGTGWSTSVPTYNPREIIYNLKKMLNGEEPEDMAPWYRGFNGDVTSKTGKDCNNFNITGKIEQVDEQTVVISELPVGKWTTDYKQMIEGWVIGQQAEKKNEDDKTVAFIRDFKENHTDTEVLFTITLAPEKLAEIHGEKGGLIKKFKLETSVATSNMHLFDQNTMIKRFEHTSHILKAFYYVRIDFYQKRKLHLISKLTEEFEKLDNKARFIKSVINGSLVVANRKKSDLLNELKSAGYKSFSEKKAKTGEDGEEEEEETGNGLDKGYDYLLSMKIWSLTMERFQELITQRDGKKGELDELAAKPSESLWLEDLDALELELNKFEVAIEEANEEGQKARKKAQKNSKNGSKSKSKPKAKKYYSGSDDDDEMDDFIDEDDDSEVETKKPKKAPVPKKATFVPKPAEKKPLTQVTMSSFVSTKSVASSKPVAAKPESKPQPKPKPVKKVDSDEEDEKPMSLFERLRMNGNIPLSVNVPQKQKDAAKDVFMISSDDESEHVKPVPAKKATTKAPRAAATKKPTYIDDLDEDSEVEYVPNPTTKAPRAAATKKNKYVDSEDEDDFIVDSEEDDFNEDDEDDDDEYDGTPKAKKAAKPVPKAKETKEKKAPVANATKGIKRAKKSAVESDDDVHVYSPGVPTPKPTKKAKKATTSFVEKKQPAKVQKKSKKIIDSDDEEENFSEEEVVMKRSPKATRERKPSKYVYVDDDDEDDDEEDDDDEDDYDE